MDDACAVTFVLPCRDEAEALPPLLDRIHGVARSSGLDAEVLVVDNGSTDGSARIARRLGARVVEEPRTGYGFACRAGIEAARHPFVVLMDADNTYPPESAPHLLARLDDAGLVLGLRAGASGLAPAIPWMNRTIGIPVLDGLLRLRGGPRVRDSQSGMRAFRRSDFAGRLQSGGMELASEMLLLASRTGLGVAEVPISYGPRTGTSKLRPLRDGSRHLRLLLGP